MQELFPSWLFMTVLFKSEKDCGAALFCAFRSKEERFGKQSLFLTIPFNALLKREELAKDYDLYLLF